MSTTISHQIKAYVVVRRRDAILAGLQQFGRIEVSVDVQALSPEQRTELCKCRYTLNTKSEQLLLLDDWSFLDRVNVEDFHPKLSFSVDAEQTGLQQQKYVQSFLTARIAARAADVESVNELRKNQNIERLTKLKNDIAKITNNHEKHIVHYPYGDGGPFRISDTLLERENELSELKEGVALFKNIRTHIAKQNKEVAESKAYEEKTSERKQEFLRIWVGRYCSPTALRQFDAGLLNVEHIIQHVTSVVFEGMDSVGSVYTGNIEINLCEHTTTDYQTITSCGETELLLDGGGSTTCDITEGEFVELERLIHQVDVDHENCFTYTIQEYNNKCKSCCIQDRIAVVTFGIEVGHTAVGGLAFVVSRQYVLTRTFSEATTDEVEFNTNI